MTFADLKPGAKIYGTEATALAKVYGWKEPAKYSHRQGDYVVLRLEGLTITLAVSVPVYKCKGGYTLRKETDSNGTKDPAQMSII